MQFRHPSFTTFLCFVGRVPIWTAVRVALGMAKLGFFGLDLDSTHVPQLSY